MSPISKKASAPGSRQIIQQNDMAIPFTTRLENGCDQFRVGSKKVGVLAGLVRLLYCGANAAARYDCISLFVVLGIKNNCSSFALSTTMLSLVQSTQV